MYFIITESIPEISGEELLHYLPAKADKLLGMTLYYLF
ncbi:MAG: hypothetical protein ACI9JT_000706 [Polaribacter sp.]|jgi:hypothetical protein